MEFRVRHGWRIDSEVLPLKWRQVDFKGGEVRLDAGTTKNGDGRVFPLTDDLRALLETRAVERDTLKKAGHIVPWVFWQMVAEKRGGKTGTATGAVVREGVEDRMCGRWLPRTDPA